MATHVQTRPISPDPAAGGDCLMGNLGWLLDQANHALGCEVAAALAPLGLGQRGFCVLSAAMDADRTQTELATMIGVDKTTMVVTVDELERKGLAKRIPSPTDRRARVITVTSAGRAKVAEGQQIFAGVQILPTTSPLPFYAYPFFVATFFGWIWTLLKTDAPQNSERSGS